MMKKFPADTRDNPFFCLPTESGFPSMYIYIYTPIFLDNPFVQYIVNNMVEG